MKLAIFRQAVRERKRSAIIWSIALFLLTIFTISLFESIGKEYEAIFDEVPPSLQAFVGDVGQITTPEGYLGIELFGLMVPISLSIITIGAGASAIGKEEKSGTLELLLASPVSRAKILFEKALSLEVISGIVAYSVWFAVALGSKIFDFNVSLINTFWACFAAWLLAVSFGYFALMVQSLMAQRGVAIGISIGLVIVTYFANTFSTIADKIEPIKYISPFYYFDGQGVLEGGPDVTKLVILFMFGGACYWVAHFSFIKRNTGV